MSRTITRKALQTLFYATLTCPCPVTEERERALMKFFLSSKEEVFDFQEVFALADKNPAPTPVHLFRNFYVDRKDTFQDFAVEQRDVLRYFTSHYHFERSVSSYNPRTFYCHASAYLVSHMLLPVTLDGEGRILAAEWRYGDFRIRFENNVFLPGAFRKEAENSRLGAVHLGGIVTDLSQEEADFLNRHLADIPEFLLMASEAPVIDSSKLYKERNHTQQTLHRVGRHMEI
ncbi:MAG TPA: hypothetical protein PK364_14455 [Synergistaceae bacterium]|nr:hypothetical protein [Synergistaceae bacterium]